MPDEARVIKVLIASPGDVLAARDEVERALHIWNDRSTKTSHVVLQPKRWEIAAVPLTGQGDAQTLISSQFADECEIVIGIFHHRIGTVTARALSGTVEEVERAVSQGKLVHLYFCTRELPYELDLVQFAAVKGFRRRMEEVGLVATFSAENELESQILKAMDYDVSRFQSSTVLQTSSETANAHGLVIMIRKKGSYAVADRSTGRMDPYPDHILVINRNSAEITSLSTIMNFPGDKTNYGSLEGPTFLGPGEQGVYKIHNLASFGEKETMSVRVSWRYDGHPNSADLEQTKDAL
jgi:hypothetical protein